MNSTACHRKVVVIKEITGFTPQPLSTVLLRSVETLPLIYSLKTFFHLRPEFPLAVSSVGETWINAFMPKKRIQRLCGFIAGCVSEALLVRDDDLLPCKMFINEHIHGFMFGFLHLKFRFSHFQTRCGGVSTHPDFLLMSTDVYRAVLLLHLSSLSAGAWPLCSVITL